MRFDIEIGNQNKPVTVEYSINNGGFVFVDHVLISAADGPFDISGYLSLDLLGRLANAAQIHYLNQAVDHNEQEILKNQG